MLKFILYIFIPVLHILFIPFKLLHWFYLLFIKEKKGLIYIGSNRIGHIIYNISYINRIEKNCYLLVKSEVYDMVKYLLNNEKIFLYSLSEFSFKKLFKAKIGFLFFPPLSATYILKYTLIFMPFNIFIGETPFFEFTTIKSFWNNFLNKTKCILFVSSFRIIPYMWSSIYSNVSRDIKIVYEKVFVLNSQVIPHNKNKSKIILINLFDSNNDKPLPFKALITQLQKIQQRKIYKILFIGVGEKSYNLSNVYISKLKLDFPSWSFLNNNNKTTLLELSMLIEKAELVISTETGVPHLSYFFNTKVLVYISPAKNDNNNWYIKYRYWNTNNHDNFIIINPEVFDGHGN